jgi:N-acetyl-gamma-glutamyl-phosphate reductase/N-acetyl-gamma-glutamyl-phosphate/LysW-gamma-L-alpha-aminoadipyl-6-phosphate reductase
VTVLYDEEDGRIVVLSALDNLVKGAAGQAVQAANLRFELPEETGLTMQPVMPV